MAYIMTKLYANNGRNNRELHRATGKQVKYILPKHISPID